MSSDVLQMLLIAVSSEMAPTVKAGVTLQRDFTAVLSVDWHVVPTSEFCDIGTRACDGTCQSRSSPGQRGDKGVSQWPASGTRARRGLMQRRACKVESSMIIIMTMRMMELNVLWLVAYVLWGEVVWWCMKLLTITVYKLYIHYNGVIIFATGKPEENKQSTPHRKCHSHLWGPNIALSHWQNQSPLTQGWRYRAVREKNNSAWYEHRL